MLYNTLGPRATVAYFLSVIWILIFSVPLLLNRFGRFSAARLFTIIAPLCAATLIHLLYGWEVRLESAYLLLAVISIFFFQKKAAIVICFIIALAYTITVAVLTKITPPLKELLLEPVPFLYFGMSSTLVIIITLRVLAENAKYNQLSLSQKALLKEQNEELEMFSRIASHDLKAPVRNVLNFSNLMESNLKNQNYEELEKNLKFVMLNSLQMSDLIEDIKQFSSIDNPFNSKLELVNLKETIIKVKHFLKTEIEDSNAVIICENLPSYRCNPSDMLLVFQNIIQNGIKYNRSSKRLIEISFKKKSEKLEIYIKDNGIGIKEEYFSAIFDLFKRLHSKNEFEGTGLGLTLSKKILQKYDGEITVESKIDAGSTFVIHLPV